MTGPAGSSRPIALITGGSGGIGLALARCFARGGFDLVLVARGQAALAAAGDELRASGSRVTTLAADLSRPDEVRRLLERFDEARLDPDVLVNNAGFGAAGPFASSDASTTLDMIGVNITALTALTRGVLPGMLARGAGRILNVASTAAFQPGPYLAVYYASKAYVLSFSEAIAEELHGSGISVTTLCPGPTETHFAARAGMTTSRAFRSGVTMTAEQVARAGYAGTMRGARIVVPGAANRLLAAMVRFAPRRAVTRIAGRLNRGRDGG